ncbi:MAG: hypothetical protein ACE366_27615 [Bradymonadia bacterium]
MRRPSRPLFCPPNQSFMRRVALMAALSLTTFACDDSASTDDGEEIDAMAQGGAGGAVGGAGGAAGAGGEPMGGAGGEPVGGEGGAGGAIGGAGGEPMGGAGGEPVIGECDEIGDSVEVIEETVTLASGESEEMVLDLPDDVLSVTLIIVGEEGNLYSLLQFSGPEGQVHISERPIGYMPSQLDQFLSPWPGAFFSPNRAAPSEVVAGVLVPNNPELEVTGGEWRYKVVGASAQGAPISGDVQVVALVKRAPERPTCGRLDMHFYFTGSKGWTADTAAEDPEFQAAFGRMVDFYAPLGIEVHAASFDDVDGSFAVVDGIQGANNELHQLFAESLYDDGVNLFFVERIGGQFGGGIGGISGGVPGPNLISGTARSGVVVTTELDPNPLAIGHIMGHEVGHYLGLFHTSEALIPGVNDTVPDTPEGQASNTNLMFPTVTDGEASMTEGQGTVLHNNATIYTGEE